MTTQTGSTTEVSEAKPKRKWVKREIDTSKHPFLTEKAIEAKYGISVPWLRRARGEHYGPPYMKLGRLVRYIPAEFEAWLQSTKIAH